MAWKVGVGHWSAAFRQEAWEHLFIAGNTETGKRDIEKSSSSQHKYVTSVKK